MPRKTAREPSPSSLTAARRKYLTAKREYHKVGKLAMGKPSHSPVKRRYCEAKHEYHRAGRKLASLTRRKTRR